MTTMHTPLSPLSPTLPAHRVAKIVKDKKAKEAKDKKEQQLREAKEKREAEMKERQAAVQNAARSAQLAATAAIATARTNSNGVAGPSGVAAGRAVPLQPAKAASAGGRQVEMRDVALLRGGGLRAQIHVAGLSPRIAKEEILRRHEYFGQYGKIQRVVVHPVAASPHNAGLPALTCSIAYASREEAEQAVLAVDHVVLDGRTLKATHSTPDPKHQTTAAAPLSLARVAPVTAAAGSGAASSGEAKDEPSVTAAAAGGLLHETRGSIAPRGGSPTSEQAAPRGSGSAGVAAQPGALLAAPRGSGSAGAAAQPGALRAAPAHGADPAGGLRSDGALWEGLACGDEVTGGLGRPTRAAATAEQDQRMMDSGLEVVLNGVALGGGVGMVERAGGGGGGPAGSDPSAASGVRSGLSCMDAFTCADIPVVAGGGGTGSLDGFEVGSFEDLLNGLVGDETEEELELAGGSSRFARFFDEGPASGNGGSDCGGGGSGGPGGGLDGFSGLQREEAQNPNPFESLAGFDGSGKSSSPPDDWQAGFRALLPNVNISFSPFGNDAPPQPGVPGSSSDALSQGRRRQMDQRLDGLDDRLGGGNDTGGGGLGSLGGIGSFGGFSGGPIGTAASAVGNNRGIASGGGFGAAGGAFGHGGGKFGLNGGVAAPGGTLCGGGSVVQQVGGSGGGQLPGAHLPGSQLSSSLQSLLSSSNTGGASGGGGGGGRAGGRWGGASGSGGQHTWDNSKHESGDPGPSSGDSGHKDGGGSRNGKKDGDRAGKGKKRGGANNRGKGGGDGKGSGAHK